jgi:hypothetical protein
MSMALPRLSRALVAGALVGGLGLAAACSSSGGGSNSSACSSIQQTIQKLNQTAMSQVANPTALAKTYHDEASSIRATANGASGSVKTAGLQVATALDGLGTDVGDLANLTSSTTPRMPDTSSLTNAGIALKNACT